MNSESAQKGFKTFILTLSISLILFSALYYFITNAELFAIDENQMGAELTEVPQVAQATPQEVQEETPQGASPETSVFGEMVASPSTPTEVLGVADKSLLAAGSLTTPDLTPTPTPSVTTTTTTTTGTVTQSTSSDAQVPETGVFSLSLGLFSSFLLFVSGMILVSKNPRKIALSSFEKNITKKL